MEEIFHAQHSNYVTTTALAIIGNARKHCDECSLFLFANEHFIWKSTYKNSIHICGDCYQRYLDLLQFCQKDLHEHLLGDVIVYVLEYAIPKWAKINCNWLDEEYSVVCPRLLANFPCFQSTNDHGEYFCLNHGNKIKVDQNVQLCVGDLGMYCINDDNNDEYIYIQNSRTEYWRCLRTNESDMILPEELLSRFGLINMNMDINWFGSVVAINEKLIENYDCENEDVTNTLGSIRSWIVFDDSGDIADFFAIVCCDIKNRLYKQVYTGVVDDHGRIGINDSKMKIEEYLLAWDLYNNEEISKSKPNKWDDDESITFIHNLREQLGQGFDYG